MSSKNNKLFIALFLIPVMVVMIVFFVFPLFFLIWTSMTDWTAGSLDNIQFVWFDNYIKLFYNDGFWQAVINTLIWIGCAIFLHMPVCIIASMILSQKIPGWKMFRTVYFFPQIISGFSLAMMWLLLYNAEIGAINEILKKIGLGYLAHPWLSDPKTALGALIFMWFFNVGNVMIICMSQITTIPQDYYDAAELDGASKIQQQIHITLPMLKGAIGVAALFCVTLTLKTFEAPYLLTNGGPGTASLILPLMMYKNFTGVQGALANAIGVIFILFGGVCILIVRKLMPDD